MATAFVPALKVVWAATNLVKLAMDLNNGWDNDTASAPPPASVEAAPPTPSVPPVPAAPSKLKYTTLSTQFHEIRILKLNRSSSGVLTGELEMIRLTNPVPYTALSYRWGHTITKTPIKIDGVDYFGTSSLKAALEHLYDLGHRRVWADALCINQDDEEEKSLQVRIMHLIYSKAYVVVAYVGQVPRAEAKKVKDLFQTQHVHRWKWATHGPVSETRSPALTTTQAWITDEWTLIDDFFKQPYWERMWIIQEIATAQNVEILYAGVTFSWNTVAQALQTWNSLTGNHAQKWSYTHVARVMELRQMHARRDYPSLFDALRLTYKSKATVPQDRIFALLELSHDGTKLVPLPTYMRDTGELLGEMTVEMMRRERSLDLVYLGPIKQYNRRGPSISSITPLSSDCPSWVPNWFELWSESRTVIEDTILERRTSQASFSGVQILPGGVLRVRGVILDNIESISSRMKDPHEVHEEQLNITANAAPSRDPFSLRAGQSLWRVLCLSEINGKTSFDAKEKMGYRECLSMMFASDVGGAHEHPGSPLICSWFRENRSMTMWGPETLETISHRKADPPSMTQRISNFVQRQDNELKYQRERWAAFTKRVTEVLGTGMRLAVIGDKRDCGHPFAMVTPEAQKGDTLCLLDGCSVPVILRRVPRRSDLGVMQLFAVVGPAYMDAAYVRVKTMSTTTSGNMGLV